MLQACPMYEYSGAGQQMSQRGAQRSYGFRIRNVHTSSSPSARAVDSPNGAEIGILSVPGCRRRTGARCHCGVPASTFVSRSC
jgi:hypothetical protein